MEASVSLQMMVFHRTSTVTTEHLGSWKMLKKVPSVQGASPALIKGTLSVGENCVLNSWVSPYFAILHVKQWKILWISFDLPLTFQNLGQSPNVLSVPTWTIPLTIHLGVMYIIPFLGFSNFSGWLLALALPHYPLVICYIAIENHHL